ACAGDSAALVKALAKAPGRVLVDGEPISHCFTANEDAADVQALGTSLVGAAQRLGDRAASDARAALELGYLIGAARRGSERSSVTAEMVRRLEGEAGRVGSNASAYKRGLRAGLVKG
ncbi:MAG: hypothetical protein ACJ76Z_02640, partial [Thermoleophilaceae bacterium]